MDFDEELEHALSSRKRGKMLDKVDNLRKEANRVRAWGFIKELAEWLDRFDFTETKWHEDTTMVSVLFYDNDHVLQVEIQIAALGGLNGPIYRIGGTNVFKKKSLVDMIMPHVAHRYRDDPIEIHTLAVEYLSENYEGYDDYIDTVDKLVKEGT